MHQISTSFSTMRPSLHVHWAEMLLLQRCSVYSWQLGTAKFLNLFASSDCSKSMERITELKLLSYLNCEACLKSEWQWGIFRLHASDFSPSCKVLWLLSSRLHRIKTSFYMLSMLCPPGGSCIFCVHCIISLLPDEHSKAQMIKTAVTIYHMISQRKLFIRRCCCCSTQHY